MNKIEVLNKLIDDGVISVVRAETKEEALKISEACVKGGIHAIEITFTMHGADELIQELTKFYQHQKDMVVGAGTVLDVTTARIAILSGAKFVVSPCFDEAIAKLCNLYQIPYMPGCMTITEMKKALESGVDIIKLFPGNTYGPEWIKSVKDPLPQANFMPTGGVSLDNVAAWIKSGCVAVGIGGNLSRHAKTGDYEQITKDAREFVKRVEQARRELV